VPGSGGLREDCVSSPASKPAEPSGPVRPTQPPRCGGCLRRGRDSGVGFPVHRSLKYFKVRSHPKARRSGRKSQPEPIPARYNQR
jgi:hypothetical protein